MTFTPVQYDAHITALKKRLASKQLGHLHVRVEDPFVVVGNGSPAQLARSAQTVRWAADKLEQDFFDKRPARSSTSTSSSTPTATSKVSSPSPARVPPRRMASTRTPRAASS